MAFYQALDYSPTLHITAAVLIVTWNRALQATHLLLLFGNVFTIDAIVDTFEAVNTRFEP